MNYFIKAGTLTALAVVTSFSTLANAQEEQSCEIDRPIIFAGLDWDSNAIHTEIARFILEKGYNCKTDVIPGTTIPLLNGQIRGDIDITMEIWRENVREIYDPALESGKLVDLGINYPDAVQGWFVPNYLITGDGAPAPDLKSVFDLKKYKDLFADPEEPGKGRFYNGVAGWSAEEVSTKKLHAYGLNEDFVNFRAGSGSALVGAAEAALLRKRPIIFYYWGPTWFLGKAGDQVTMLEEPDFDQKKWEALQKEQKPEDVKEATAFPIIEVTISATPEIVEKAPQITEFLKAYETTGKKVSEMLAWMQDNDGTAEEAALNFLKNEKAIWQTWVSEAAASKIDAAL